MSSSGGRSQQVLYYGLPMLFCLVVHWLALKMWFFTDDFAWLGLRLEIHSAHDLVSVLFSPRAQGTVRTVSERLFFLVFSSVFGLESPPFRVWVFLTQFANIGLLIKITRRLTGSAAAGFIAPFLWSANGAIALAICWSSAYNEIAFAFFILLAFWLLLRYIDTGERKYWIWQWVVFVLGFGVLELNVVYPALASGYALCCARRYFRKTLALFVPSILFTLVHFVFIPSPSDSYYAMHFDAGMVKTFWDYWAYATGALRNGPEDWRPLWLGLTVALLVTLALLNFVYRKVRGGEWLALFLAAWFTVVLLPVVPLKNHFTEYYPFVPVIGLVVLASWGIASSSGMVNRGMAMVLTSLYLTVSITDIHATEKFRYDRSRRMKYLIKGLEARQRTAAHKVVLLRGIDNDLFWTGFCDDPFRLIGISQVYVVQGAANPVEAHPEWGCDTSRFILSLGEAAPMLRGHEAVVYALEGRNVRDVTQQSLKDAETEVTTRRFDFVDIADPAYQDRLGPEWYPAEQSFRWMPKRATVKLAGPRMAGQALEVSGYCPAVVLAKGPLIVSFRAEGVEIGATALKQPGQRFDLRFPLPEALLGRPWMELEIEVNRTTEVTGDPRSFGLVFTTFRIK